MHTPEETSPLIGGAWTARTLRDKAGRKEIPHTRIGRAIRFSHDDIAQLIRDGASGRATRLRRDSRRHS
nr:helix-turn-helix domain-containing protein [Actinomadura bangladeshensis]